MDLLIKGEEISQALTLTTRGYIQRQDSTFIRGGWETDNELFGWEHLSLRYPSGDILLTVTDLELRPRQERKTSNGNRGHGLGKIMQGECVE